MGDHKGSTLQVKNDFLETSADKASILGVSKGFESFQGGKWKDLSGSD